MDNSFQEEIQIEVKAGQTIVLDIKAKKGVVLPKKPAPHDFGAVEFLLFDENEESIDLPAIYLVNEEKTGYYIVNRESAAGHLSETELVPGKYQIVLKKPENYDRPNLNIPPDAPGLFNMDPKKFENDGFEIPLTIQASKKTVAPIQLKDQKITHIGVYPRKDPIGWSRMYMHLWKQAGIELTGVLNSVEYDTANNLKEKWVLDACRIIGLDYRAYVNSPLDERKEKAKQIRINPSVISYDDMVNIIASKGAYHLKHKFIEFDKDLKDEKNKDSWFYRHSKYKWYFPEKPEPKHITWWWKPIEMEKVTEGFKLDEYVPEISFTGIRQNKATYLPYPNNKVKFYNNASDDQQGTSGAFRDIYEAIHQAEDFIFIADWSFHPYVRLLHNNDELESRSIGRILFDWVDKKPGRTVAIHTWDHTNLAASDPQNDDGDDHLEEIFESIPGNEGKAFPKNVLWRASSVEGIGWSHHQKYVVLDYDAGDGKRGIKAFIGGLDLTQGRFDWHEHPISATPSISVDEFKKITNDKEKINDWYNAEFTGDDSMDIPRQPWRDVHCLVAGPTAQDIVREFTGRWNLDPAKGRTQGNHSAEDIEHIQDIFNKTFDSSRYIQQWEFTDLKDSFNAQIIRSMEKDHWGSENDVSTKTKSGGDFKEFQWNIDNKDHEKSIQDAYLEMIKQAEHFIYIETQYFIGSCDHWNFYPKAGQARTAKNKVPETMVEKILEKARAKEDFHVFLILPHFPEGDPGSSGLQGVRDLQWNTISYVIRAIQKAGFYWKKYLTIGFFANWHTVDGVVIEKNRATNVVRNNRYMVYVHSKAMIVDDKYCIIGSCNLNERGLNGDRDTEIGVAIWPPLDKPSAQIFNFRKDIWNYYFGIKNPSETPLHEIGRIQRTGAVNYELLMKGKTEDGEDKKTGHFCTWPIDGSKDDLGIRDNKQQLIIDGYSTIVKGDDYYIWPIYYACPAPELLE